MMQVNSSPYQDLREESGLIFSSSTGVSEVTGDDHFIASKSDNKKTILHQLEDHLIAKHDL